MVEEAWGIGSLDRDRMATEARERPNGNRGERETEWQQSRGLGGAQKRENSDTVLFMLSVVELSKYRLL